MMKGNQTIGIVRNKFQFYCDNKKKLEKRKNRFKVLDRDDEPSQNTPRMSENLLTSASTNSVNSLESIDNNSVTQTSRDFYQQAKKKIQNVAELQKKMTVLTKARLSSFKQKQNEKYDQQISKLASQATTSISQSQKILRKISTIEYQGQSQRKMIKNMQLSLAQQIRQCSRNLRHQQRQYYNTVRQYQSSSSNQAIQLNQQQKKMFQVEQEMMQEHQEQGGENNKINELVHNINKLSGIYKELNNLVIEQGSLIDRIDVNIEQTFDHTQNAVKHLVSADEHASSTFADKMIKVLVVLILTMALLLGVKYMA